MYNAITTLQTSLLKKTELRTLSLIRGPTNTAGKIIRYCILSYQANYGKQDSINKSVSIIIIIFFSLLQLFSILGKTYLSTIPAYVTGPSQRYKDKALCKWLLRKLGNNSLQDEYLPKINKQFHKQWN